MMYGDFLFFLSKPNPPPRLASLRFQMPSPLGIPRLLANALPHLHFAFPQPSISSLFSHFNSSCSTRSLHTGLFLYQKQDPTLHLDSLQLLRERLEGHCFKRAFLDAERKSAWIDQILTKVRFLLARGVPMTHIDQLLHTPSASVRLGRISTSQLDSYIVYFRSLNFEDLNITCLVRRSHFLSLDVQTDIKPKIDLLQGIGFTGRDLEKLILKQPRVLKGTLDSIRDLLLFLESVPLDKPSMYKVLMRCPDMFLADIEKTLKPRRDFLRNQGIAVRYLSIALVGRPKLLSHTTDATVSKKFDLFEEFGIERNSAAFAYAAARLTSITCERLRARFNFFMSLGFTRDEVVGILRIQPSLLARTEGVTASKVSYLTNVMNRPIADIVSWPHYLSYSLEKRIQPRFEAFTRWKVLNAGRDFELQRLLRSTDEHFSQRLFKGCGLQSIDKNDQNYAIAG